MVAVHAHTRHNQYNQHSSRDQDMAAADDVAGKPRRFDDKALHKPYPNYFQGVGLFLLVLRHRVEHFSPAMTWEERPTLARQY